MENALLIGLSRQMVLRRELDVVANNIANVNTSGFKSDRLLFNEHLMPVARADAFERPDRRVHYVIDRNTHVDHTGGQVQLTGSDFDVAIQGRGMFVVETPRGTRYTRAGAFQRNAEGEIVTTDGSRLMSEGGPIRLGPNEQRFSVAADGTISTELGIRGRIRVVEFENPASLRKDGDTTFSATAEPRAATNPRLVQGALERSNVQPIQEVARMIEITRAYASISQIIDRTQDLRRTAIERLGQQT